MTGKAAWIIRIGAMQRLAVVMAVGIVADFAQPRGDVMAADPDRLSINIFATVI